tara:strand:+ start:1411 stop:2127 length:717 start_codon:yes stop_codon:yes gene_type:complete
MGLPKITAPTFYLKFPTTGREITYRPFLVKEEKILLMAQEGGDQKEVLRAVIQVLNNCCLDEDLNIKELSTFDLEYYFLQVRARSIGEVVNLMVPCQECDVKIPIEVDLLKDVNFVFNENGHNKRFDLTDTVGVTMKYPTVESSLDRQKNLDSDNIEDVFSIIIDCIESVYDDKGIYYMKDTSREEAEDFLYGLPQVCFDKIREFFDTMPKIQYEKVHSCKEQHEQLVRVEGMNNFFG